MLLPNSRPYGTGWREDSTALKSTQPQLTKVGPHGYVHGWIKVGDMGDMSNPSTIRNGDKVKGHSAEHGDFEGTVVGSVSGPIRSSSPVSSTTVSGHHVAIAGTDTRSIPPIQVANEDITHVSPKSGF